MGEGKQFAGSRPQWIFFRRLSQGVFFIIFLVLFLRTDYNGTDTMETAVNLLFRLDPFLAASVMFGVKTVVALMWPSLIVLLFTFFFGRVFCGWFCPMGTVLDVTQKVLPAGAGEKSTSFPRLATYLLIFSLAASVCGVGVAGLIDPFSILVRGLAQAIYPLFNSLTVSFFTVTYNELPEFVNSLTEPVYGLLKSLVLPAEQKFFQLAYLSMIVLLVVILLDTVQRRFFCRNICPLGAMLGIVSRRGVVAGSGGNDECRTCRICARNCRMGAIGDSRTIDMAGCNLCFECVGRCPRKIIGFDFRLPGKNDSAVSLSRRKVVGAMLAGVCLASLKKIEPRAEVPDPRLIRPPGAQGEKEFLQRCVRCAECIQVCPGNALQPAFLEAGLDGMFSPILVARTGYCEFNCTLCGQVCPTGAIARLSREDKWRFKIGHAWFDKNICLPYAKAIPCMVCEEHCPTPEKAIRFLAVETIDANAETVIVKQPYVVDSLCIGCGICENKCPLPGKPAIYVTSGGEQRNPDNSLPLAGAKSMYG